MSPFLILRQLLQTRLTGSAHAWFQASSGEIGDGASDARLAIILSGASRHARDRHLLEPTEKEREAAEKVVEGWNLERWTLLETLRVTLLLSRTDLEEESAAIVVEDLFTYADEGEQRALYRSLALLPNPERFLWRAGEGCRTNMTGVFEAVVLDTPYAARFFDDVAWKQAVIKSIFIGVPLWRLWGLDERLDSDLSRMALDLADERRSASREVQPNLWLCLGPHGGARGLESLETELRSSNSNTLGRRAAAYAMVRAGQQSKLEAMLTTETDPAVKASMQDALAGNTQAPVFRALQI